MAGPLVHCVSWGRGIPGPWGSLCGRTHCLCRKSVLTETPLELSNVPWWEKGVSQLWGTHPSPAKPGWGGLQEEEGSPSRPLWSVGLRMCPAGLEFPTVFPLSQRGGGLRGAAFYCWVCRTYTRGLLLGAEPGNMHHPTIWLTSSPGTQARPPHYQLLELSDLLFPGMIIGLHRGSRQKQFTSFSGWKSPEHSLEFKILYH